MDRVPSFRFSAGVSDGEPCKKADKRVAFVGNSSYRNVTPLDNPRNDAGLMAETLRSIETVLGNLFRIAAFKSNG